MSNLAIIKKELEATRPTFDQLNLTGLNFNKEVEFACQAFMANSYLAGADKESIKNAVVNTALTGLSLNPILKYASLVPRKVNKVLMACLDPQYIGLCKILTDTGSVVGISATLVYEKEAENFEIIQGMGGSFKHKAYVGFENPGKIVACYSVAILPNGMKHVELIRPFEWESIRERSESVKNYRAKVAKNEYCAVPIWLGPDAGEMIRKTCLKKHYKYLPKTEKAEMIAQAIQLDNDVNGIDFNKEENKPETKYTPSIPVDVKMASNEQIDEIMELFDDPALPEVILHDIRPVGFKKAVLKANIQKTFDSGTYESDKADALIQSLHNEITKAKEATPATEETTAEEVKPDVDLTAEEEAEEGDFK